MKAVASSAQKPEILSLIDTFNSKYYIKYLLLRGNSIAYSLFSKNDNSKILRSNIQITQYPEFVIVHSFFPELNPNSIGDHFNKGLSAAVFYLVIHHFYELNNNSNRTIRIEPSAINFYKSKRFYESLKDFMFDFDGDKYLFGTFPQLYMIDTSNIVLELS